MVHVNVGVHGCCIGGEESGIVGKGCEAFQFVVQVNRVSNEGWLLLGCYLKVGIHPDANGVEKQSTCGDDGACLPGCFVYFCCEVELGEGVFIFLE